LRAAFHPQTLLIMSAQLEENRPTNDAALVERHDDDRRLSTFLETRAAVIERGGDERRKSGDRRGNLFRKWPRINLGGLPVAVIDRRDSAKVMVDEALNRKGLWRFPAYLTSTNGEVAYRCATDSLQRELFARADFIHADGMPHVFASRLSSGLSLPERVATTDLFYDVAREASARGATMYMLGATESSNKAAVDAVQLQYPGLNIVGARHGYFAGPDEEAAVCDEIATLAPDILWVSMGVPHEQRFVLRHRQRLASVGVIKTSGGLFDFLSGRNPRAPQWMQNAGLEWLWRVMMEPRRLGWRYLKTNPLALYLLLRGPR
jgi:N-acetylglucosaminyldiphosphoundecaprenol N-acetyl-beta-D-mannosaminyltransferase